MLVLFQLVCIPQTINIYWIACQKSHNSHIVCFNTEDKTKLKHTGKDTSLGKKPGNITIYLSLTLPGLVI